jgi:hypothetical protein
MILSPATAQLALHYFTLGESGSSVSHRHFYYGGATVLLPAKFTAT